MRYPKLTVVSAACFFMALKIAFQLEGGRRLFGTTDSGRNQTLIYGHSSRDGEHLRATFGEKTVDKRQRDASAAERKELETLRDDDRVFLRRARREAASGGRKKKRRGQKAPRRESVAEASTTVGDAGDPVYGDYMNDGVPPPRGARGGARNGGDDNQKIKENESGPQTARARLEGFIEQGYNPDIEVTIEFLSADQDREGPSPNELPVGPAVDDDRLAPDPTAASPTRRSGEAAQGEWGAWGACSVTCGDGRRQRRRQCGPELEPSACGESEVQACSANRCSESSEDPTRDDAIFDLVGMTTDWHITQQSSKDEDEDGCEVWVRCKSEELLHYLSQLDQLPSCPCRYPGAASLASDGVWDPHKKTSFRWNDASSPQNRLDIFKPTAKYCIRSKLLQQSTNLAAQNCCYDAERRLITRGPGAGTPALISSEISYDLHYRIDIMPWIMCKGDWTRYNAVRQPNNYQECLENPDQDTYLELARQAKLY